MTRGRADLEASLDALLDRPDERTELEAAIEADFGRDCAVLVLDMSGFARETQLRGIVAYLATLRELRRVATPAVDGRGGAVVKAEADNLYCVFERVPDAIDAGREIMASHGAAGIGIGYGRVLDVGDDVWGNEVNLASKLGEDLAVAGEILLTEAAFDRVELAGEERRASISGLELRYFALTAPEPG